MKVVLIYRKPRPDAFSMEVVFHAIAAELSKRVEVVKYETGTRWKLLTDVWRLRKMRADIYHVTGDVNFLVPLLPKGKTVLTVHDIGNYLYGLRGLKRWMYKWLWLLWPMQTAGAVTAVSRETQRNILNHLGIAISRVAVIDNCHNVFLKPAPRPFDVKCPVILQVGTTPYKNVHRLVSALQGIQCRLVLIGQLDTELGRHLEKCGVVYENRHNLSSKEIASEYVKSDIVSFVSLGEGFGVPIIEAQASGRPLITSNIPPMCDVAGAGACLVNPLDIAQIHEGIVRIISDSDYRNMLVKQGLLNASRYSPARISGLYLELYKRMVCM